MSQGEIVDKVVTYVVSEIVDDTDAVEVNIVSDGDDAVVAEVRAAKSDMGRVIGKRGRVARAGELLDTLGDTQGGIGERLVGVVTGRAADVACGAESLIVEEFVSEGNLLSGLRIILGLGGGR